MTILNNIWRLKETRKNLRNWATESENIFWKELQWKKILWLKFRRQHSVWRYILRFSNEDIIENIEKTLEILKNYITKKYDK